MLRTLQAIKAWQAGDGGVLRRERWLLYLALSAERRVNRERAAPPEDHPALRYTARTLEVLESCADRLPGADLLEEALAWCETAKAGMPHHRRQWREQGVNLFAHNIGSAQLYERHHPACERTRIVSALIATHGLIGQTIRGEAPLADSRPLYGLVTGGLVDAGWLERALAVFNRCILAAVSEPLWERLRGEAEALCARIARGDFTESGGLRDRMRRLRGVSIAAGEDFDAACARCLTPAVERELADCLNGVSLWYVEAALQDFTFEEFIKIWRLIARGTAGRGVRHVSFESLMDALYRTVDGGRRINLYKKRIMEHYLGQLDLDATLPPESPHIRARTNIDGDVASFGFAFSPAGERLTAFCLEAERAGVLYEQAILLLFDLFGLRRDRFDRFYNEDGYLAAMNDAMRHKRVLLEHMTGRVVLDVGPGGGGLMDMTADAFPDKEVWGVDLSRNVLDALEKRRVREGRRWRVMPGDALRLEEAGLPADVDTIVFCSVLHELFSYIETDGRRFNHDTVARALRSAWAVLPPGGRLLIRDGVMTAPEDQRRIIRFRAADGMDCLRRYAADFKGRAIRYAVTGQNEVEMPVNDAMEFLYTYTWGEESYVHEVQEQFGYFTPDGYRAFLREVLGDGVVIVHSDHFLQPGYAAALEGRIEFFDADRRPCRLPDSTCIFVIEKQA